MGGDRLQRPNYWVVAERSATVRLKSGVDDRRESSKTKAKHDLKMLEKKLKKEA